jgi:tetratricopeptide (TPR) repeat protein
MWRQNGLNINDMLIYRLSMVRELNTFIAFISILILIGYHLSPKTANSQPPYKENKALEFYTEGLTHYHSEDYEQAIFYFEKALTIDPENKEIRKAIGACYFQLGAEAYKKDKLKEAKGYFYKVVEYLPDDLRGYQNLALILIKLKEYKEAEEIAKKGLKLKKIPRSYS